jgi:hypothetical protein
MTNRLLYALINITGYQPPTNYVKVSFSTRCVLIVHWHYYIQTTIVRKE